MIIEKFLELTNDLLFKETFGSPANTYYLEDFLECYFKLEKGKLKNKLEVKYESPILKYNRKNKSIRGDLIVIIDHNIIINLEMYKLFNNKSFFKSLNYIMRIYTSQIEIGIDPIDIKTTQINIAEGISSDVEIEITSNLKQSMLVKENKHFGMDLIRLDLLNNNVYEKEDRFIKHLKFLAAKNSEERKKIAEGDEIFMKVEEWLEKYTNDEEIGKFFNDYEWNKWIYKDIGLEEGKKEGKIAGQKEEKFKIAQKMIKKGYELQEISDISGLSIEKLKSIQSKNS